MYGLFKVGDVLLDDIQQLAAADHLFHLRDVRPNLAVDLVEVNFLAHMVEVRVERMFALTPEPRPSART